MVLKLSPGFFGRLHMFQVLEETGEIFSGNGEALEAVVELSQEAPEGEGGVGKFPQVIPPNGGLKALPCYPELPLL